MYLIYGFIGAGDGSGNRDLRVSWRACRVASARSMIVRASIVLVGDLVFPWIQSMKVFTC